jgi:hypothetical protein
MTEQPVCCMVVVRDERAVMRKLPMKNVFKSSFVAAVAIGLTACAVSAAPEAAPDPRVQYTVDRAAKAGLHGEPVLSTSGDTGDVHAQLWARTECISINTCRCCWTSDLWGNSDGNGATCQGC